MRFRFRSQGYEGGILPQNGSSPTDELGVASCVQDWNPESRGRDSVDSVGSEPESTEAQELQMGEDVVESKVVAAKSALGRLAAPQSFRGGRQCDLSMRRLVHYRNLRE